MGRPSGGTIGPYQIRDLLGAGGMGAVYRAYDPRLRRHVAVKVLLPEVVADVAALDRFEREVRAVAALSHPNILAIYDFQRDGETVYAAMELLAGGTLRDRLRKGPLPPRKAVEVGIQVARGLAAAHEQNIAHRDLKPENIAFTRDGRVKILDFGLAREFVSRLDLGGDLPTQARHTLPGLILGTAGYMSPEQIRGQDVDHRSDVFALGAVLHEMMTGRRAFSGKTAADTMSAILNDDIKDLSESGVSLPPALDRVVRRCLEKHPGERFHSARDLAFALENAAGSGSHHAYTSSASGWRRSRAARAALLVGAGLAAGVALTMWARPPAPGGVGLPMAQRLTLSNLDSAPAASPDGKQIAFASNRRGGIPRIWRRDLATGGEQEFSAGPDRLPRFSFSDNGDYVFFLRREAGVDRVFRQPVRGTAFASEVPTNITNVVEADPSPDGRRLAFIRFGPTDGQAKGTLAATVGVIAVEGPSEGRENLYQETGVEFTSLRWSRDGTKLAFVRRVTATSTAIVIVDANSGEVVGDWPPQAGLGSYGSLAWSNDDRHLVATQRLRDTQVFVPGAPGRVALVDSQTGLSKTLLYRPNLFSLFGSAGSNARIDVLPDGRLLLEDLEIRHNLEERWLIDDSFLRQWTTGGGLDRQPVYSSSGDSVVFSSNRSNNLDLWLGTRDGGLFQLTNDPADDWDPAFSPNGKNLLWSSNRILDHLEVWTAPLILSDTPALGGTAVPVSHDGENAQNPTMTSEGVVVYRSARTTDPGVLKIDAGVTTVLYGGSQLGLPDVSHDGRYALFVDRDRPNLRVTIRVVDVQTGRVEPFEIPIDYTIDEWNADIRWGRARWMPDGDAIVFVGQAPDGQPAIYRQTFIPGRKPAGSATRIVASEPGKLTESFDISPDGKRIIVSFGSYARTVVIVSGVLGIGPVPPGGG